MLNLIIKNTSFRHLWLGQLVSALGDRLTQMGILTFIMVTSGDQGNKMALLTFFSLLPFLLFGPLFGSLADRRSRKHLMLIADISRAVLVLGIPFLWLHTHSVLAMLVWFFALGSLTALFSPAKMSIITNITDKDVLLEANSLIVTTGMVATLLGTLLAGAVIKAIGIQPAFYLNALTYLISALFIGMITMKKPLVAPTLAQHVYQDVFNDIKVGLGYMVRHRLIVSLMVLSSIFSLISSFGYILILNYGSTQLKQGPLGMGALLSSAGFGMVIGSAILMKRKEHINFRRALYIAYFIVGIFIAGFVLKPSLYVSFGLLVCVGIGLAMLTITLDTIFQRVTPDDLKGKLFAARGVVTNVVFLASLLLVGFLVKHISVTSIIGFVGAISLLTGARIFLYERRWGYQLLCFSLRIILKLFFDFKVSGLNNLPKSNKVVLAGNHTSLIDGVALACAYPRRIYFLAAESVFKAGFWGWCARRLGYIPVKRAGFNKEAIKSAVRLLHAGYSVGIFPEGKISADGMLDQGKEGVAVIARLAHASIVPFAIEGAHEAWPLLKKYPKRFPIEVRFSQPIDTKQYLAQEELVNEVMKDISKTKLYLEREGYLRVEPQEIVKHLINIG
ncbi:MAG: MFS transporter [Candidatus Omnitrophica bacterium]|nr:MFS transporter [Candidatus Omnitrophota bacterium]